MRAAVLMALLLVGCAAPAGGTWPSCVEPIPYVGGRAFNGHGKVVPRGPKHKAETEYGSDWAMTCAEWGYRPA